MPARLTHKQAADLGLAVAARPHKYRAKRTEYAGVTYHSKSEAAYAARLDAEKAAGRVSWWLRQVPVYLGPPGDEVPDKTVIDFLVCRLSGVAWETEVVGVEVKGVETPAFRRIKRAWKRYGPFQLVVVRNGKDVERIERGSKKP